MVGNTTLLIGTEDNQVQKAMEIIKEHCPIRKQIHASTASYGRGMSHMSTQEKVKVGGATIFVLDVAHMEKI